MHLCNAFNYSLNSNGSIFSVRVKNSRALSVFTHVKYKQNKQTKKKKTLQIYTKISVK